MAFRRGRRRGFTGRRRSSRRRRRGGLKRSYTVARGGIRM